MADSSVVFPRKLVKRLIELYKELPCLWDRNCVAYKYKRKRHEALTKLTELVQEYDPNATRVHVLRKIESLRACVRREYKRVQDSRQRATSLDEIYTPHLWYYDLFSFVFGKEGNINKSKMESTLDVQSAESDNDGNEATEDCESHYEQSAENYSLECNSTTNMIDVQNIPPIAKEYATYEDDQNKSGKRFCTEIEDEYDAIGVNVAAKLRSLPPNMRILAEKLINDVLYQAQMNGLNSSSVISTLDPFKPIII